uniref:Uncharacterized protein n=1 Tax=Vitis vinifera TaxID=29760 RepID=A5BH83_VITVI|nr:hypothetical protein VITISV_036776 [Vitis vinifera]
MCPTVAKWRCDISAHGLHSHLQTAITFPFQIQIEHRLKLWTPISQLRNEGHCAVKWHSCAKSRLRNCEIPCGMGLLVRNQALPLRNAFRSCEMDAPVLRSGTHVPKLVSQLRKFSQRGA